MEDEYAQHKIGFLVTGDFFCTQLRAMCHLRTGHTTKPAHAQLSRTGVASIQMAHLVGLLAWACGEFFIRCLCRNGVRSHLQLAQSSIW